MDNASTPPRRRFLLAAGVGGATAVAAVGATIAAKVVPPIESSPLTDSDKRRGKGYAETAHVRNYYRTTQV